MADKSLLRCLRALLPVKTSPARGPAALHSMLLALEPRMVFDASVPAVAGVADATDAQPAMQAEADNAEAARNGSPASSGEEPYGVISQVGAFGGVMPLLEPLDWSEAPTIDFASDADFTVNENETLDLAGKIAIDDPDSASMRITISVERGALSLSYVPDLVNNEYVWNADKTQASFEGDIAAIRAALNTLKYTGDDHYNGFDTLKIIVEDGYNATEFTQKITISAVTDKPEFANPGGALPTGNNSVKPVDEDVKTKIEVNYGSTTASWGSLQIIDPDSADEGFNDTYTLTLTVANGSLFAEYGGKNLADPSESTDPDGNVTRIYSLDDLTLEEVNGLLADLAFLGEPDFNGKASLTLDIYDDKAADTLSRSFEIDVLPINDDPTINPASKDEKDKQLTVAERDNPATLGVNEAEGVLNLGHFIKDWDGTAPGNNGNDPYPQLDIDNNMHQLMVKVTEAPAKGVLWRKIGDDWVKLSAGSTFSMWDVFCGNVKYAHNDLQVREDVYAGSSQDSFKFELRDGAGGGKTGEIFINLTPVNQAPEVSVRPSDVVSSDRMDAQYVWNETTGDWKKDYTLWAYEGEQGIVFSFDVDDIDQHPDSDFSVSFGTLPPVSQGKFWYKATDGGLWEQVTTETALSLERIQAGNLVFNHSGVENGGPVNFTINVTDDGGGEGDAGKLTASKSLSINIRANNDHPEWDASMGGTWDSAQKTIVLAPGVRTALIDESILKVTDKDSASASLTYTITAINQSANANGYLLYDTRTVVDGKTVYRQYGVGDKITQEDIRDNRVVWIFYGSGDDGDPRVDIQFVVRDGAITAIPVPSDGEQAAAEDGSLPPLDNYDPAYGSDSNWENGSGAHEGSIGKWVEQSGGGYKWVKTVHTLTITAANLTGEEPGTPPTIVDPAPNFGGVATGVVKEGNKIQFTGDDLETGKILLQAWFTNRESGAPLTEADAAAASPMNLTYRIEHDASHGQLLYSGDDGLTFRVLGLYDNFTQDDVNEGRIYYLHNGGENFSDYFRFSVSDGRDEVKNADDNSTIFTQSFDITPINDSPSAGVGDDVTVDEHDLEQLSNGSADANTPGGVKIITDKNIVISDRDNETNKPGGEYSGGNDLYVIITSEPKFGALQYYDGADWVDVVAADIADIAAIMAGTGYAGWDSDAYVHDKSVTVISLADIKAGKLRYQHNGSENFYDSFNYLVSDNKGVTATNADHASERLVGNELVAVDKNQSSVSQYQQSVNIAVTSVNDMPQWTSGVIKEDIALDEGGSVVLTSGKTLGQPAHINYTDPDGAAAAIQFVLTKLPGHGQITLNGQVLGEGASFTQADIDAGRVKYAHDSSENHADYFTVRITDSIHTSDEVSFDIRIDPVNDPIEVALKKSEVFVETITGNGLIINDLKITDKDHGEWTRNDGPYDGSGVVNDYITVDITVTLVDKISSSDISSGNIIITVGGNSPSYPEETLAFVDKGDGVFSARISGPYEYVQGLFDQITIKAADLGSGQHFDPNGTILITFKATDSTPDGSGGWEEANGGKGPVYDAEASLTVYISPINDPPKFEQTDPSKMAMDNSNAHVPGLYEDAGYTRVVDADDKPIKIGDSDAFDRSGNTLTLTVENGALMVGSVANLGISGQGSKTITLTGSLDRINEALANLQYKPNANWNGVETIQMVYKDNANSGEKPTDVTSTENDISSLGYNDNFYYDRGVGNKEGLGVVGSFAILVKPVNDDPTIKAPDVLYLEKPHLFDGLDQDSLGDTAAIILGDIDITGPGAHVDDYLEVTLTVTSGVLDIDETHPGYNGGAGDGTNAITLKGTLSDLNAILKTLKYEPTSWNQTIDTLTVTVTDPGTAGNSSNGSPTDAPKPGGVTHDITLYCSDENDAPAIGAPSADWEINEGALDAKPFQGVSLTDPDSFSARIFVAFRVDYGALDISGVTGFNTTSGNPLLQDGLTLSADGKTVYFKGSCDQIEKAIEQIKYVVAGTDWNGKVTVSIYANDLGYTGQTTGAEAPVSGNAFGFPSGSAFAEIAGCSGMASTETHTLNVLGVNDAPTIKNNASAVKFWSDDADADWEDSPTGTAKTVETLFSGVFVDARDDQTANPDGSSANTLAGVVVIGSGANPTTQGVWQYHDKNDPDTANWTWRDISAASLSQTNGLYLGMDVEIRFNPVGDFNGVPGGLVVHLVDNSEVAANNPANPPLPSADPNGVVSGVDLSIRGGDTRYSDKSLTLRTFIRAINDAPIASGSATLAPIAEDATDPAGATVSSLFGGGANFSDAADNQKTPGGASASPANSLHGVLIVGDASNALTQGVWQYNAGGGWQDLPTDISATNGFYLLASSSLRFAPVENWNGTPGGLTAHLADNSAVDLAHGNPAALAVGGRYDPTATNAIGGNTRYSAATVTLNASVSAVNDAPVVNGTTETMPTIDEDPAVNNGESITALFLSHFDDSADDIGGSSADSFAGVLVVDYVKNPAQGDWQYSTNGGASWTSLDNTGAGEGTALSAGCMLRFNPAPDFNGAPVPLTVRLIDSSVATTDNPAAFSGGGNQAVTGLVVPSVGGTTRYSADTVTLDITVTAVNDAPTASDIIKNHTEDTTTTTTVEALFKSGFSDAKDDVAGKVAGGGSSANGFAGVMIATIDATSAQGEWQHHDGSSWLSIADAIEGSGQGLFLAGDAQIRFVPAPNYNGALGDLSAYVVETGAITYANGTLYDVGSSSRGGATQISGSALTLSGSVGAVNDAPVASGSAALTAIDEDIADGDNPGQTIWDLYSPLFSDEADNQFDAVANPGGTKADALAGIIVVSLPTGAEAAKGVWKYHDGADWKTVTANIYLSKDAKIRFEPAPHYNGAAIGFSAYLVENSGSYAASQNNGEAPAAYAPGTGAVTAETVTVSVTVNAANDAPTALGDTVDFWSGDGAAIGDMEDASDPTGKSVETLFKDQFQDVLDAQKNDASNPDGSSANDFAGVVIVGNAATTEGNWQYSLNNGDVWINVGARALTSGLYLDAAAILRFAPAANFNGEPGALTVRLADSSASTMDNPALPPSGGVLDLSGDKTGGATRFSDAANAVTLTSFVRAVNDAPTVKTGKESVALPHTEDRATTVTVADVFGPSFSDADDDNAASGGSQANAFAGVIVTGGDVDSAQGVWRYEETPGAGNWKDIDPSALSDTGGLFLSADTKLKFAPAPDYNGVVGDLTARLVEKDDDGVSPYANGEASIDVSGENSGLDTRVSAAAVTLSGAITPVNDAPTITGGLTVSLADIQEDYVGGDWQTVSSLFGASSSSGFDDSTDDSGGSSANAFAGVLVVGNAATAGQGVWQYHDGVGWKTIPDHIPDGQGFALKAEWHVQFAPIANFNGAPGGLTVRLIDDSTEQTVNSAIVNPAAIFDGGLFAYGGHGGETRYSAEIGALGVTVTAVNDAPTVKPGLENVTLAHTEDLETTVTVADIFGPSFSDDADDKDASDANLFAGVVITGNAVTAAQGVWEYFDDGEWRAVSASLSESAGLYLAENVQLRFTPAPDYNGVMGDLTARLVEEGHTFSTAAPADVSGANSGFDTRVSAAAVTLSGAITPVNDAPIAKDQATPIVYPDAIHEDEDAPGRTVADIFGPRFDDSRDALHSSATNPQGSPANLLAGVLVTFTGVDASKGVWEYEHAPSDWRAIPAANSGSAVYIDASVKIRFQPVADWNGTAPELTALLVETGAFASAQTTGAVIALPLSGGTTSISDETLPLTLQAEILPVNDAPTWNPDAYSPLVNSDTGEHFIYYGAIRPVGGDPDSTYLEKTVREAMHGKGGVFAFLDARDTVAGGSSADDFQGVLIIGNANNPLGDWQYFDGADWRDIPSSASESDAFYLAHDTKIRFVYDTDYNIPVDVMPHASLSIVLVDSSGASGALTNATSGYDASTRGGSTAFSEDSVPLWATVLPRNYYPIFAAPPAAATANERQSIQLSSNIAVADNNLDHANSANKWGGASVTISREGGPNAEDTFSALDGGDLSALTEGEYLIYNGIVSGEVTKNSGGALVLTFASGVSAADVNAILRAIAYANESHDPPTSVTLQWLIDDGNYESNGVYSQGQNDIGDSSGKTACSQTIIINPINEAPVGVDDKANVSSLSGVPVTGNVLANDWDWDTPHSLLTVSASEANDALYGVLTINADGSYAYMVNRNDAVVMALRPGETLTEVIAYTVSDGSLTSTAYLRISIENTKAGFVTKCDEEPDPFKKFAPPAQPFIVANGSFAAPPMELSVNKPVVQAVQETHNALNASLRSSVAALQGDRFLLKDSVERHSVTLVGGVERQTMHVGVNQTLAMPKDLFRHSQQGERLFYTVTMADGSPLPAWLAWNGDSMSLSGMPDKVLEEPLIIKVTARDQYGNSAATLFHLFVTKGIHQQPEQTAPPATGPSGHGNAPENAPESPDAPMVPAGGETPDKPAPPAERRQEDAPGPGASIGAPGLDELVAQNGQLAMLYQARECIRLLL